MNEIPAFFDDGVGSIGCHKKTGFGFCVFKIQDRSEIFRCFSKKLQIVFNIGDLIKTVF